MCFYLEQRVYTTVRVSDRLRYGATFSWRRWERRKFKFRETVASVFSVCVLSCSLSSSDCTSTFGLRTWNRSRSFMNIHAFCEGGRGLPGVHLRQICNLEPSTSTLRVFRSETHAKHTEKGTETHRKTRENTPNTRNFFSITWFSSASATKH